MLSSKTSFQHLAGHPFGMAKMDLIVCGRLEDSVFRVKPIVLDLRVCYLGGVQQGQFSVYSAARAVTSVYARVPRPLAPYVAVLPSQTLIQARSATTLTVRLVLSRDFPTQCSDYLDPATGLLSFSVQLAVGPAPCPPLELPVVALVAPPCPLSLAPALLDLGQVSTYETLYSPVTLTNHNTSCPYNYAFVDLPQRIVTKRLSDEDFDFNIEERQNNEVCNVENHNERDIRNRGKQRRNEIARLIHGA
ncbi:hypothetical protein J6590_100805 [Homalodisca vitripennis]|nr:hypothetical protein J6590_100805 [Homalodisca vitripennis]